MTKIDQIIELYNSLSFDDQILLKAELNKDNSGQQRPAYNNLPIMTKCPYCQSKLIIKHGTRDGVQRYKCKSCYKVFISATGTSHYYLHKKDKFER